MAAVTAIQAIIVVFPVRKAPLARQGQPARKAKPVHRVRPVPPVRRALLVRLGQPVCKEHLAHKAYPALPELRAPLARRGKSDLPELKESPVPPVHKGLPVRLGLRVRKVKPDPKV